LSTIIPSTTVNGYESANLDTFSLSNVPIKRHDNAMFL
jgi:hypothetical protein